MRNRASIIDNAIRINKPANLRIIVPAVEVIQSRLGIVVISPIAEGIGVACCPAVGVLHRAIAPCVVRIPGHNPAVADGDRFCAEGEV